MNKRKFEVITKWKKKTINYIYSKMVRYYHDFKWKDKWKSHTIVIEVLCRTQLLFEKI